MLYTERGPWLLIGRVPDRNPYTCTETAVTTYVGPSASITDQRCFVWTLGSGTTPNILILRNGVQATPTAKGSVIEYYNHTVYVKGTDGVTWYSWDYSISDFQTFGTNDPSMSSVPVGIFVSTTGSDSNSCTTAHTVGTPKRHIYNAVLCPNPGETVWVRAGTYDEGISAMNSGTDWTTGLVRVAKYPGDGAVTMFPTTPNHAAPDSNPGSVVYFRTGAEHYIEFDGIDMNGSTAGVFDTIRIIVEGTNPTLQSHHVRFKNATITGMTTDNTMYSSLAAMAIEMHGGGNNMVGGFEFINLTITGGGRPDTWVNPIDAYKDNGYGIYISVPNVLVDHCDISGGKGAGIHIFNDDFPMGGTAQSPDNAILKNNTIHDETRNSNTGQLWGILAYGTGHQVYNNVIYNVASAGGSAVTAGDGLTMVYGGNKVMNNTVTQSTLKGLYIFSSTRPDGSTLANTVINNIVYNNGSNYTDSAVGTTNATNLTTDPVFASPGTGNFRLAAASGPAYNAGTSSSVVTNIFTTDREDTPRPQSSAWDIGAYEFH